MTSIEDPYLVDYIDAGDKWLSETLGKGPRDELFDLLNALEGREE